VRYQTGEKGFFVAYNMLIETGSECDIRRGKRVFVAYSMLIETGTECDIRHGKVGFCCLQHAN
jgi:hypothetical protein